MTILNFQYDPTKEMLYLETTDPYEKVVELGYLNKLATQNVPLAKNQTALVSTCENGNTKFTKINLYDVVFVDKKWGLVKKNSHFII